MSPLSWGPGSGPHRVLGPGSSDRCRTHRVPLGPERVPEVPGERLWADRLAADAAARMSAQDTEVQRTRWSEARGPGRVLGVQDTEDTEDIEDTDGTRGSSGSWTSGHRGPEQDPAGTPRTRMLTARQARCPRCVQEYAAAALARVNGEAA